MLHLGKRVHPAPPAAADLTYDPAGPDGCARGGAEVRRRSGLDRLTGRRHRQVHIDRNPKGRFIRHAGALALPILALAVAMVRTPFGGLLMAAVSLAALEAKGFLTATGAAITLAPVTTATEVKHHAAGRKVAYALAKDCRAGCRHRFGEGALDNRRRSWQDDSR
jgi:hypothetical protein